MFYAVISPRCFRTVPLAARCDGERTVCKEPDLANITLVDDDENIVASVSLALESHGHKVTAWHDGASGLEALEASPPDLAILDVKMPRMDGMEVLRRLRRTSDMPVIILTSKDEEIDEILMNAEDETYSTPPVDIVNRPPHYNQSNDIECIDAMRAAYGDEALENHCVMNAFKYIWRAPLKGNAIEDLAKARWYIDDEIAKRKATP